MPVANVKSKWSSGNLVFYEAVAGNGAQLHFGVDDDGLDVKFFGATSGAFMLWDESADQLVLDKADIQLGDSDYLKFGDATGGDVSITWDGSNLVVLPAADDTGIFKFGNGTKDMDVNVYLGAATDYLSFDVGNKALQLHGDARLDLSNATIAAANTDGGVLKAGTSGSPVVEDTANMKFISLYFDNGATSGDSRGIYNRLYITGAGGGGESLRSFTSVDDVAGATAHGAHLSLNFGDSGSITGLGVATRSTLHIPDASLGGGTYAALQAEIWSDGSSSAFAGTELSFIRVVNAGDATGLQDIEDSAFLMSISGGSIASGNMMQAQSAAAVSHVLRIKGPDGNTYYLMVSDAA